MSDAFVFNTEPKNRQVPDIPFTLDDREYLALAPKKIVWATFLGAMTNNDGTSINALLTFLDKCLGPADQNHLENRFRDPEDDLDFEDLLDVLRALYEEWEPYFAEEFAELSGENRATRRQAARRTPAKSRRAPARRPAAAAARQDTEAK